MKHDLLKTITLVVNGKEMVIDVQKEFNVSGDSLEKVPVNLGYLVALQNLVLKELYKARNAKDIYYSNQFGIIKGDYEGSRPPSDETVKTEIMDDVKYQKLLKKSQDCQANYDLVSGLLESYKIRTEVLRTLSANQRKEMDRFS